MEYEQALVSVGYAGGTAAVVIDREGDVWLTDSFGHGGSGLNDYQPTIAGLPDGKSAHGGRLPSGASTAVVIDVTGEEREAAAANGAWVIVLEGDPLTGPLPVRFAAADGVVIAAPLPPEWPREPLDDATEDCPACGARCWDVVTPLDDSRGGASGPDGETVPSRVTVCRRCGHEVRVGVFFGSTPAPGEEEAEVVAARVRAAEERRRRRSAEALAAAGFPIYAIRGRSARLTGWGTTGMGSPARTTSVEVAHGDPAAGAWVRVETTAVDDAVHEDPLVRARRALERTFEAGDRWPDISEPAVALWLSARQRERSRASAAAATVEFLFKVDGRPIAFRVVSADDRWAAVGAPAAAVEVTIAARGVAIDGIELVACHDLLALLA